MLDSCSKLRQDYARRRENAMINFEAELEAIGDLRQIEEVFNNKDLLFSHAVDHNIGRLLSTVHPKRGNSRQKDQDEDEQDDYYEDGEFGDADLVNDEIFEKEINRRAAAQDLQSRRRREPPTFEERGVLRSQLFSVLESSQEEEEKLVCTWYPGM